MCLFFCLHSNKSQFTKTILHTIIRIARNPVPSQIMEVANYGGAFNKKDLELNKVLLESYIKKHPNWTLSYKKENGDEVAILDIMTKVSECQNTVDRIYTSESFKKRFTTYKVNQANLPLDKSAGKDVPDLVCDLPDNQNKIHLEMNLVGDLTKV